MSFLTYRAPVLRSALTAPATRVVGARRFSVSTSKAAFSEGDIHHENRAEEIEKHKHDSLNKQKDGEAHWKKELASQSEASVKADRGEATGSPEDIKNLQKQGEKVGKQ